MDRVSSSFYGDEKEMARPSLIPIGLAELTPDQPPKTMELTKSIHIYVNANQRTNQNKASFPTSSGVSALMGKTLTPKTYHDEGWNIMVGQDDFKIKQYG